MENIGRIGGRFDFTTMEDGAADEVEARAERAQTAGSARPGSGRVVLDKNSGRTAKVTGIPTDMYQTVRSYTGERFEKKRMTEVQDMLHSKQKYGFRSTALQLQVGLAEKLRLALDNEAKFDIYREMFDEVIRVDASYSELLASIKAAYDDRLALVPVGDEDYVSFAAFQQQEQVSPPTLTPSPDRVCLHCPHIASLQIVCFFAALYPERCMQQIQPLHFGA
jgi:hypothetical protein